MYKKNDHQEDNVNSLNYDVNILDRDGLVIFQLHLLEIEIFNHYLMY